MDDTIVAISTALGVGAISIVRVSGGEAVKIVNSVFNGKNLKNVNSHTINYGHIHEKGKIIDEVLISIMLAPKTFTREDIVEINCHGGITTTNKILEILLNNGCRLAEPGEFTKRAFLNGRIDLIEAEGVMDLINSKTEQSRELAINQVSGKVSDLIRNLRQQLLEIIANIEVNIDYPEYEDIEEFTINHLQTKIKNIKFQILKILEESENGKIIKDGIKTAILGKPNVGKSSILNKLIDEEKAIVTDIPGTTRDIVEGTLNIGGLILNISDTAGIRKTDDIVESIGVKKSLQLINNSDLILYVLNNNEKLEKEELEIISKLKNKNHIIIINKTDLKKNMDDSKLEKENIIYMSSIKNIGFEELKIKIKNIYNLEKIITNDLTYLTNARSISILKNVILKIEEVEQSVTNNEYIDMIEIDIKNIWQQLGEIIGETYEEELIDQLFIQFCLGK
ncbi:MAG: tRNA uridine-5-carboxymethylaminomethyl(34) synthesis GTPase MnmE [Bacilli bacterium]|nr:tRNA uridine-5-carboxymethylaminomethyl(34) synthesis GTPase MnmE [Bacilli bacterium]MDD4282376.1 tRNA uridine-5-carboxymethylaminomethyl(34) synthesis GTPase MnmE [Bacilli bacterium]MDD4718249.1 tRNA uridine-5-carboxymethylaminomethyl(34) synthesis GTPase MnmE [Bacilli bacterium]